MEDFEELLSENDFKWYKRRLDVLRKYEHDHSGIPDHYPCRVKSQEDGSFGVFHKYSHTFIYKEVVKCDKCGHTQEVWPK